MKVSFISKEVIELGDKSPKNREKKKKKKEKIVNTPISQAPTLKK